jgi:hypothetical protein
MHTMLSSYGEAQGDYDDAFKRLLLAPRPESGSALAQLHARLLWCQMDADDQAEFRDRVLTPVVARAAGDAKTDAEHLEDLAELAGLLPEPVVTPEGGSAELAAWKQMVAGLEKRGERFSKAFASRRVSAKRERANPPVMVRRQNFCTAENVAEQPVGPER